MLINGGLQLLAAPPPSNPSLRKNKPSFNCIGQISTAAPTADAGLLFREKLIYLAHLKIDTRKALTQNPNLRSTPLSALHSIERCLASMGLHRAAVGRILDMYPRLLTSDPYLDIYPIFDFLLNEVGIPFPEISKSISRCPRILVCSVEAQLRPAFEFLQSLGFVGRNAITAHTTVLLVYNIEITLKGKLEYMKSLGFEESEVRKMVVRSPGILTFSIENNLVPKIEYFQTVMKGDLEELKRFPQYFSFSLEGKIKPRHRMLVQYGLKLPLSNMLKVSDGDFIAMLMEMRLGRAKQEVDRWK
ncbi:unnamed protein product [Linum tenue]|uniref:Uncharacterized protein n=1 Tax=Linum tenue TaxID=586396 RepID=A0AAV0J9Q4_9ROSI|nr:unnamed protein product [Linum tenue]